MIDALRRALTNEEGQDLIEYALIAGFISVVCYLGIQAAGVAISDLWGAIETATEAIAGLI